MDDFNRFVKDKISDEFTSEQKEQIEQVGLKNSIIQALRKEGVSDEKINLLLNDENVRRLISDYENRNNVNASKPNNTNTHKLNNEIILKSIEVIAQKNFQDYLVDGSEAINYMVEIVGEEKAATAILVTQFATQGIVKTSVSMLMEKGKDTLFGGVKDKISNYISKDLFEVNDKGWQDKQKQAIYSLSDVSADFSIDLAISGPFALMKGAKNLGKANKKFDENLKENNVNSDTIANSNAELKRNEHNLNNKNSNDGVGVAGNKTGKAGLDKVGKKSSDVTSDITRIDNSTSNTNIKHNGNSDNDGIVVAGGSEIEKLNDTNKYTPPKGGGGTTNQIIIGNQEFTFGHGGRHLYEKNVNLNHTEVENAIANELYGKNLEINKHYKNTIEVNGITIEYNAFKRDNGVINIGTYYVPETK